jgi:hypothetical protein
MKFYTFFTTYFSFCFFLICAIQNTAPEEPTIEPIYGAYDIFYIDSEHGGYTLTTEIVGHEIIDRSTLVECIQAVAKLSHVNPSQADFKPSDSNETKMYAIFDHYINNLK